MENFVTAYDMLPHVEVCKAKVVNKKSNNLADPKWANTHVCKGKYLIS
jgi:hypothetical protein